MQLSILVVWRCIDCVRANMVVILRAISTIFGFKIYLFMFLFFFESLRYRPPQLTITLFFLYSSHQDCSTPSIHLVIIMTIYENHAYSISNLKNVLFSPFVRVNTKSDTCLSKLKLFKIHNYLLDYYKIFSITPDVRFLNTDFIFCSKNFAS